MERLNEIEKKVERHDEKITTLFKRTDTMDWMRDTLTKLTTLMEITIEDNKKRDAENKVINERQNQTLDSINSNLSNLNGKVEKLEKGQESLTKRVDENESKHTIDTRNIDKEKKENLLKKWGVPFSVGIAIGTVLLQAIQILKG